MGKKNNESDQLSIPEDNKLPENETKTDDDKGLDFFRGTPEEYPSEWGGFNPDVVAFIPSD